MNWDGDHNFDLLATGFLAADMFMTQCPVDTAEAMNECGAANHDNSVEDVSNYKNFPSGLIS